MPAAFNLHTDFEKIDWDAVAWHLNGNSFEPNMDVSLIDQGIDHKSILRFATPGLNGIKGSGS